MSNVVVVVQESGEPSVVMTAGAQGPKGPTGAQGPPGPAGGGVMSYEHEQSQASNTWTITHNLGYRPAGVYVVDTAGTAWECTDIEYPDLNTLILHWRFAFAGSARLS